MVMYRSSAMVDMQKLYDLLKRNKDELYIAIDKMLTESTNNETSENHAVKSAAHNLSDELVRVVDYLESSYPWDNIQSAVKQFVSAMENYKKHY